MLTCVGLRKGVGDRSFSIIYDDVCKIVIVNFDREVSWIVLKVVVFLELGKGIFLIDRRSGGGSDYRRRVYYY